jgi:hypothetical protein
MVKSAGKEEQVAQCPGRHGSIGGGNSVSSDKSCQPVAQPEAIAIKARQDLKRDVPEAGFAGDGGCHTRYPGLPSFLTERVPGSSTIIPATTCFAFVNCRRKPAKHQAQSRRRLEEEVAAFRKSPGRPPARPQRCVMARKPHQRPLQKPLETALQKPGSRHRFARLLHYIPFNALQLRQNNT